MAPGEGSVGGYELAGWASRIVALVPDVFVCFAVAGVLIPPNAVAVPVGVGLFAVEAGVVPALTGRSLGMLMTAQTLVRLGPAGPVRVTVPAAVLRALLQLVEIVTVVPLLVPLLPARRSLSDRLTRSYVVTGLTLDRPSSGRRVRR